MSLNSDMHTDTHTPMRIDLSTEADKEVQAEAENGTRGMA